MPFPLIKLASLLIKQMSKPLTNITKQRAKTSPAFRRLCIGYAGWYHKYEVNVKMKLLGFGKSKSVQPLSEEAAVELGANMFGEAFLYSFLVGIIAMEHFYSSRVSAGKEDDKRKYLQSLETQIGELGLAVTNQEAEIRQLHRTVGVLQSENLALIEKVFPQKKKG